MGLIRQVQSLLPKFASVQENYRNALRRVNHLREYCHNYDLKLGTFRIENLFEIFQNEL